jgi:hypothetical protein
LDFANEKTRKSGWEREAIKVMQSFLERFHQRGIRNVVKQNASHWFARALIATSLLVADQSSRAADGAETAKPINAEVSAETHDLIEQIKHQNTNAVVYNNDGSVVSLNFFGDYHFQSGKNLKLISGLSSVKEITLRGYFLTEDGVSALQRMTNLATLRVCGKNRTNDDFWAICRLNQLQGLDLIFMPFRPADLPYLARMTNLEELKLSSVQLLGSNVLPALTNLVRLKKLRLGGGDSENKIFAQINCLTNLKNLEELSIYGFPDFGNDQLRELRHLPKLKRLSLSGKKIGEDWPDIVRHFPALTNAIVERDGKTKTWNRDH